MLLGSAAIPRLDAIPSPGFGCLRFQHANTNTSAHCTDPAPCTDIQTPPFTLAIVAGRPSRAPPDYRNGLTQSARLGCPPSVCLRHLGQRVLCKCTSEHSTPLSTASTGFLAHPRVRRPRGPPPALLPFPCPLRAQLSRLLRLAAPVNLENGNSR